MSDGFGENLPYSGFGLVKNEQEGNEQEGNVVVLPAVHRQWQRFVVSYVVQSYD